jgi:hypothetical protein
MRISSESYQIQLAVTNQTLTWQLPQASDHPEISTFIPVRLPRNQGNQIYELIEDIRKQNECCRLAGLGYLLFQAYFRKGLLNEPGTGNQ